MPFFTFRCPECGHKFEELMRSDQVKDAVCEKCGAKVERVWQGQFSFRKSGCSGGNCACCSGCKSHER